MRIAVKFKLLSKLNTVLENYMLQEEIVNKDLRRIELFRKEFGFCFMYVKKDE